MNLLWHLLAGTTFKPFYAICASGDKLLIPGGRGVNPKQMKMAMKRMGVSMEDIEDVEEVIIRAGSRTYTFKRPDVSMVVAQGQKTFQIVGEPEIVEGEKELTIPKEDVDLVASQAGVSEKEAREALIECDGEPAEAIMRIMANR